MKLNYKNKIIFIAISLCFNLQAIAQSTADCSNPEKKGSSDSTCLSGIGSSLNSAIAQPKNHAAAAIFPFGVLGKACTTPWGQAVPDNSGVLAYLQPTGHYNYSTGTWGEDCVEEYRYCNNGTLTGTYQYQNCTIAPVNGTCGPAQGAYYTYPTSGPSTTDLCNPNYIYGGYPTDGYPTNAAYSAVYLDATTNKYSWSCSGDNGGTGTSCYAYRRIDAQCGADNGTNRYSAPTALCNLGNSSATSGSWNWTCYGVNGGNNAPCYANKIVDGSCGSSNNATLASAPTSGLCNSGSASAVSGSGPWSWSCNGSYGGASPSCSANLAGPVAILGLHTNEGLMTGEGWYQYAGGFDNLVPANPGTYWVIIRVTDGKESNMDSFDWIAVYNKGKLVAQWVPDQYVAVPTYADSITKLNGFTRGTKVSQTAVSNYANSLSYEQRRTFYYYTYGLNGRVDTPEIYTVSGPGITGN